MTVAVLAQLLGFVLMLAGAWLLWSPPVALILAGAGAVVGGALAERSAASTSGGG